MTNDIKSILNNHLPNDGYSKGPIKPLSIEAVDKLADELVVEYNNPNFRKWYCGVINDFGYSQVNEWRRRAGEGREPAKLFSTYVKQTRTYHTRRQAEQ